MKLDGLQQRHHDYVLGPNQDPRLHAVAAGAVLSGVELALDSDAPFVLRSRATYCQYNDGNLTTQAQPQFVKTRLAGPLRDYRSSELVSESCQMAFLGQFGNPKPVWPPIDYPANGKIVIDLYNSTGGTITDLTFLFRGVKLFPKGAVPGYTYPADFEARTFTGYQIDLPVVPVVSRFESQIFRIRNDADFVIRGGQASDIVLPGGGPSAPRNIFIQLMDFNKKPYSNDLVRFDVLFGCTAGDPTDPGTNVYENGPLFVSPFGTGPGSPGLFYPEIYVPANHMLFYTVARDDSAIFGAVPQHYTVNLIGAKIFAR